MTAPLDGVLVADFSRVLAGPYAGTFLADLGATVVKVERPGTGDDTRAWGPPWTGSTSTYFESVNRSKLGVALDLSNPDDARTARSLADSADVMIENFRTGALSGAGLDAAAVTARNPRVVYCSITGFGSGPGAALPGYDFVVQALGGLMSITGDPDAGPTKAGVALVDVLTGKDAVIGILAALRARERSGRGQHVEVNLLSSLLGSMVNQASGYLSTGRAPARMGNRHPSIAPYETLRCQDGLLAVACGNDAQFARFATVLDAPALARDPRFATNTARVEHREALAAALEQRLGTASVGHWQRALTEAGVPAGQVGDLAQAFRLATDLGLDPVVHAADGHVPQVRHPITYSDHVPEYDRPPPALGEHTDIVRGWFSTG